MNKTLFPVCLLITLNVCFSTHGFSQQVLKSKPAVQFGDVDSTLHITRDRLLANTQIKCLLPNCTVTQFSLSVLPSGGEFRGPYITKDSDQPIDKAKKALQDGTHVKARVFIDDIHITVDGKDHKVTNGIMFTCEP